LTPNQSSVADALDQATLAGVSGPLSDAIDTLAAQSTSAIKSGLDDLAGQVLADSRRFTIDQAAGFQAMVWKAGTQSGSESFGSSTTVASAYAAAPEHPIDKALQRSAPTQRVWFGAYGSWDQASSTDVAFGTRSHNAGAALGIDLWATSTFVGGFAVGASSGKLESSGRADSVDADTAHAGFYARAEIGGFSIASMISYSFAALDSSRSISFLNQTAKGSWQAHTLGASLGISRQHQFAGVSVEPFANLDWYATRHDGFTETCAPGVNQTVQSGTYDQLFGTAGLRLTHNFASNEGLAHIGATLAVRQDFSGEEPDMTTAFEGAPGTSFAITGVEHPPTTALLGAEIGWDITRTVSFKATYEGEFASGFSRHAVQGAARMRF
jgi:uncharacterized protein with beta-barrel porin domain